MIPKANALNCPECHKEWAFHENVLTLSDKPSYWNLLSKEEMQELLAQVRSAGWAKAIQGSRSPKVRDQYTFTECPTRADGTFYLSLTKDSMVLDIGSGWGNFAFAVSPRVKGFVAADISREPLQFIALRAEQDIRGNILPVQINPMDYGSLPFADGTFDAVILNGSLEWIGSSSKKGDPLKIQQKALREVARVLKKKGQIFIGIENRFGLKYFFGYPDDHLLHYDPKGLAYTTLMPRYFANKLTSKKLGVPYRTYTHSLGGYQRMLKKAGFRDISFYWPDPDYRAVTSRIVPLGSEDARISTDRLIDYHMKALTKENRFLKLFFSVIRRLKLENRLCNSYQIIGEKK